MSQDPELSPVQASFTAAEREQLARYTEKRIQEIRSGVRRNTDRLWMFDDLEQLARELPDRLRGLK